MDYIVDSLMEVSSEEYNLIVSEKLFCDPVSREKLVDILFEYYNIPQVSIYPQPLLSLYGTGFQTGCVVDIGEDLSQICCFWDGVPIDGYDVTNFGGSTITAELSHQLSYRLYDNITEPTHRLYVQKCKELYGYIATDFERELQEYESSAAKEESYLLPDGTLIALNQERINSSELIFNPTLYDDPNAHIQEDIKIEQMRDEPEDEEEKKKEEKPEGEEEEPMTEEELQKAREEFFFAQTEPQTSVDPLHKRIVNAIYRCDTAIRSELFGNLILAGGTTLFPNFAERLTNEMVMIAPTAPPITIRSIDNRIISTWKGERILSNFSNIKKMTKADYAETGSTFIHSCCINEDD